MQRSPIRCLFTGAGTTHLHRLLQRLVRKIGVYMATNYLKKTKLWNILSDVFDITPMLKNTHYSFYRGTEWLHYYDNGYMYKICLVNGGVYLSVQKSHYDEDDNVVIDYYAVLNGYGKKNYVLPVVEDARYE